MPYPKSQIKIKKDGVEYISNLDQTQYLLSELTRAALLDVGKFIRKRIIQKARKMRGHKKGKRVTNSFQYWVRRREEDLVIGVKHNTWYSVDQELGTKNQPKRSIIRDTVFENIDEIRKIEGQYLSAIEDENKALALIDEENEGENIEE